MPKKILSYVCFATRASGLFLVICFSVFMMASPWLATKQTAMLPLCGVWVLAAALLSWPRLPDAWRKDPPTAKQLEYAASLGLAVPEGASKGQVSEMISRVTGR
jgi:4-amino-4-deoxy-L-arabinose transferase-like glycosyltransferase